MDRRPGRNLTTMQGPSKHYEATQRHSTTNRPHLQPVGIDKWENKTDKRSFENKTFKTTK